MGVTQLKVKCTPFIYSIYTFPYFHFNFEYVGFYVMWVNVIRTVSVPEALRIKYVSIWLNVDFLWRFADRAAQYIYLSI